MTVLRVAERALASGFSPATQSGAALFLHAGWRSCGTWLWATLRDSDSVRAFYEPLHEDLARLDRTAIGAFSPESWGSGHGPGAPYFAEFANMLNPNGRGVAGYQPRFAFDDFFAPADRADPALETYIDSLLRHAVAEGRLPVLKFCRSQGRVTWMERHFPNSLHAVVVRDPRAQWHSARAQLERDKNRYFVLAPFVILARNEGDPLLAEALAHLRVKLPPHLGHDLALTTEVCWHHVKHLGWADRYRGFLALWAACSVAALSGDAMVIDADALTADPAQRAAVEDQMRAATGLELSLRPRPGSAAPWPSTGADAADAARAAADALAFLAAQHHRLAPQRAMLLERKLLACAAGAAPDTGPLAPMPAPATAYLGAAAYVAATRALYPLRRAHFHVDRWFKRG
jgi:hypothetical protein